MDVTVLVYNGVTSREVLAPLAAIRESTDISLRLVGVDGGRCNGYEPFHVFALDATISDPVVSADILLVPGGLASVAMMHRSDVLAWIAATAPVSRYVIGVSTGSQLLAAAGLLTDETASGHWLASDALEEAGAHLSAAEVTWHGAIITTAGPAAAASVARLLPDRVRYGPGRVAERQ